MIVSDNCVTRNPSEEPPSKKRERRRRRTRLPPWVFVLYSAGFARVCALHYYFTNVRAFLSTRKLNNNKTHDDRRVHFSNDSTTCARAPKIRQQTKTEKKKKKTKKEEKRNRLFYGSEPYISNNLLVFFFSPSLSLSSLFPITKEVRRHSRRVPATITTDHVLSRKYYPPVNRY